MEKLIADPSRIKPRLPRTDGKGTVTLPSPRQLGTAAEQQAINDPPKVMATVASYQAEQHDDAATASLQQMIRHLVGNRSQTIYAENWQNAGRPTPHHPAES